jgi:hypothetical protein
VSLKEGVAKSKASETRGLNLANVLILRRRRPWELIGQLPPPLGHYSVATWYPVPGKGCSNLGDFVAIEILDDAASGESRPECCYS